MQSVASKIRQIRQDAGLTQKEFADKLGVSYQQISKWEKGDTEVKIHWIKTIAKKFDSSVEGILGLKVHEIEKIPVEAYVGAGAEVHSTGLADDLAEYVPAPPDDGEKVRTAIVRGDSMWPAYREGDTLYYSEFSGSLTDLVGHECVVLLDDGRQLVKTIRKGSSKGKYTLDSHNAAPIENVKITWAAPISWVKRRGV